MRLAVLAALGLGFALSYAQSGLPADQARRLLQPQGLRERAWRAWFAGTSHDPVLLTPLLAELHDAESLRDSPRDSEGYAYVQALFDSLIQIPGRIPREALLPFEGSWRPEVLILMARDADESTLLSMRGHSVTDVEWTAIGDLLFGLSSKPFFQSTLDEVRITHDFVLTDQAVAFCGGGIGCGASKRRFPSGFPPIALYQLSADAIQPGDTLLLQGPVAIYYRRIVVPTGGEIEWSDCESSSAIEIRQSRLARFLLATGGRSTLEEAEQLFHPRTTIEWRGAAQAVAEMERLLDRQSASIQDLLVSAQRRGLVQASGRRLSIEILVLDARKDRSEPAPRAEAREIAIP